MARPLKLYNYAHAPNPRRVRIFAAVKGIALSLEEVDILAGQGRTPEFLAKNSSGAVPVLELDDGSCLSEFILVASTGYTYIAVMSDHPRRFSHRDNGACSSRPTPASS